MALYRVRNNLRTALHLATRRGFRKVAAGQTRQLDLIDVNSRRMRARQQSGAITLLSVTDPRTGRPSPAPLPLHLGVGRRTGALPALPTITGTFPKGKVGTAYNTAPTLGGGQGTKSVALRGSLPAGMSFSKTTGALSGTPTAAGSFPLVMTVSDNAGSAQLSLTLVIDP